MSYRKLTATERKWGWVEYHCPDHGFLVAAYVNATVRCGEKAGNGKRCRKTAVRMRSGKILHREQVSRLRKASQTP